MEKFYFYHCSCDNECCGGFGSFWEEDATIFHARIARTGIIAEKQGIPLKRAFQVPITVLGAVAQNVSGREQDIQSQAIVFFKFVAQQNASNHLRKWLLKCCKRPRQPLLLQSWSAFQKEQISRFSAAFHHGHKENCFYFEYHSLKNSLVNLAHNHLFG